MWGYDGRDSSQGSSLAEVDVMLVRMRSGSEKARCWARHPATLHWAHRVVQRLGKAWRRLEKGTTQRLTTVLCWQFGGWPRIQKKSLAEGLELGSRFGQGVWQGFWPSVFDLAEDFVKGSDRRSLLCIKFEFCFRLRALAGGLDLP